ncbi:rab proteins geranylgeranyltransferase component A 2-like [Actinia tenebrosa]|uniref:Rab proteins geranylgeranyltransferase component A 2-like n=1 Tax=Actinia tenebrosa TaxID=6105 RepID=A0A6P8IGV7_ACTTE|nr:rab proteins geranylgeranyltransferase component A 2-like [Actinia tenebrosa]
MEEDFPTEYDAIVLGTGLPESVVAAALARVGQKVLHLDRNDYYSSQWTTFTFDGLLKWIEENQTTAPPEGTTSSPEENTDSCDRQAFPIPHKSNTISNLVTKSYFRTTRKQEEKEETSKTEVAEVKENEPNRNEKDNQSTDQPEQSEQTLTRDGEGERESEDEHNEEQAQAKAEEQAKEAESDSKPTDAQQETAIDSSDAHSSAEDSKTQENISDTNRGSSAEEDLTETEETIEENQPPQIPEFFRQRAAPKPPVNKDMIYEDFEQYFRQFNIDLAPKMLFSRGPLVEAIISANISHYAEFKSVNKIVTYLNGSIEDVPCSRSDVFSSKLISAIEKRTLMKFLTFCIDYENHENEYHEFVDKPYVEFLISRRLTPNLQHFVLHAIAMATTRTTTIPGLKATKAFLQSLGRYGNSPFIWPIYGIGELPQAFCRMCAVFGGLYCLRKSAECVIVDPSDNTCTGIMLDGQLLKCRWLIIEHSYLPNTWQKETTQFVSRAVFITDKSLKVSDHGNVTFLAMPKPNNGGQIKVYELDSSTAACPRGLYVVHFVTESCGTAQEDLQDTAEMLLHFPTSDDDRESTKPVVLWSMYFNHAASDQTTVQDTLPSNIKMTVMPGAMLGFHQAMQQAKTIFQSICGTDEEFLPAIPNPEDIIMDDVNEQPGNSVGIGTTPSDEEAQDGAGDPDGSDHPHDVPESSTDKDVNISDASNAPDSDATEGTSA